MSLPLSQPDALGNQAVPGNLDIAGNLTVGGTVTATTFALTTPLTVPNGGTGIASYAIGDLLYASAATTLSRLADVATGQVLHSGGIGVAPAWGAVVLTTDVSGTLPATNGGTGVASYAVGDLLYANTTTTLAKLADIATGGVLVSGGVNTAPAWSNTPTISGAVTLSAGTASTSTSTGTLILSGSGGVGCGGAIYTGGILSAGGGLFILSGTATFTALNTPEIANISGVGLALGTTGSINFYTGGATTNLATNRMSINSTGVMALTNTTEATTGGAGSFTTTGGLYTTKKIYAAGGYIGTATNDAGVAGNIGELIASTIASASAVSLTTATAADLTSISLTAGDWDVRCTFIYIPGATTSITQLAQGISQASATLPTTTTGAGDYTVFSTAAVVPGANNISQSIPSFRVSLASTTTIYAVAQATFTVSTLAVYGSIRARRVR